MFISTRKLTELINEQIDARFEVGAPCSHAWKVEGMSFAGGGGSVKGKNLSEKLIRELHSGVTTISSRCTECGKISTERHIGRVNIPGFTWNS